jgi:hypothetical protein
MSDRKEALCSENQAAPSAHRSPAHMPAISPCISARDSLSSKSEWETTSDLSHVLEGLEDFADCESRLDATEQVDHDAPLIGSECDVSKSKQAM